MIVEKREERRQGLINDAWKRQKESTDAVETKEKA